MRATVTGARRDPRPALRPGRGTLAGASGVRRPAGVPVAERVARPRHACRPRRRSSSRRAHPRPRRARPALRAVRPPHDLERPARAERVVDPRRRRRPGRGAGCRRSSHRPRHRARPLAPRVQVEAWHHGAQPAGRRAKQRPHAGARTRNSRQLDRRCTLERRRTGRRLPPSRAAGVGLRGRIALPGPGGSRRGISARPRRHQLQRRFPRIQHAARGSGRPGAAPRDNRRRGCRERSRKGEPQLRAGKPAARSDGRRDRRERPCHVLLEPLERARSRRSCRQHACRGPDLLLVERLHELQRDQLLGASRLRRGRMGLDAPAAARPDADRGRDARLGARCGRQGLGSGYRVRDPLDPCRTRCEDAGEGSSGAQRRRRPRATACDHGEWHAAGHSCPPAGKARHRKGPGGRLPGLGARPRADQRGHAQRGQRQRGSLGPQNSQRLRAR